MPLYYKFILDENNIIIELVHCTVKPVYNGHSQKDRKLVFKTNYRLMKVKGEHSAILLTFIKLPFVIKIFVLSVLEWPFYTGFTGLEILILIR